MAEYVTINILNQTREYRYHPTEGTDVSISGEAQKRQISTFICLFHSACPSAGHCIGLALTGGHFGTTNYFPCILDEKES